MPQKPKEEMSLYINDIFEVHKWEKEMLPFIFHTDEVQKFKGGWGNWHDSLEILQIISGEGDVLCDSHEHSLLPGDTVIINSNEVHRIRTSSEIKYHCFIIGARFCLENGIDLERIKFQNRINDERARILVEEAIKEFSGTDAYHISATRGCALALLSYLCRNYGEEKEKSKDSSGADTVRTGLEFINNNFTKELSLEDVAKKAGISKYHFLREFKRYTGHTVVKYINILRCEYAKRLLRSSDATVGDIATLCGFENQSYFSKTFKAYAGVLPRDFRAAEKNTRSL